MSVKDKLLGMPHGTASNRLRKTILFSMLYGKVYDRQCFRCDQQIEDVDDMSIEHKEPWQSANDPKAVFFDLENTAFSHLRCNSGAPHRDKTHCPNGHPYDEANTYRYPNGQRKCRQCKRQNGHRFRRRIKQNR